MKTTPLAVILVAGVGSRLRPLTDDRPKALVTVGRETILGRAVRLLVEHGVDSVVLATGYREDAVKAALAATPVRALYCLNERYDSTQNAVSLALCREAVAGRAFFKLDGDVIFRKSVLDRLAASDADIAVAVDRQRPLDAEAMKVEVRDGTRIARFGKGIALEQAAGETIGIERIAERAVEPLFAALDAAVGAGRTDLYYEDVYCDLVADGRLGAQAVDVGDLPWTEVDDAADLERARELVAEEAP
jgi:choline kinase